MNAQCYRVIFSKTLQRPVVVSELSKTAGKTNTLSRGDFICSSKFISFTKVSKIRPLFFSLWYALGFITFADNALADLRIQADPTANANQQPIVLETANGIPQVNIQTPNDKGLSHNRYQSFDVDTQGAILNNSHKNVSTQLGGMVQGNPYLAAGEAKVILNEVNSDRPSELKGYVEVAGKKADVIIANPSGLYCEGCGVINAERATLTTGKVEIENGELRSFKVEKGKITVSGRGLDASQVDYADIIARETEINAGIWAKKQINVTTGKNRVAKNNDSLEIIHDSDNSDNSDSQTDAVTGYAVDVLSLGGMYAEKIHLIGTEAGMGVRNAGHIGASAGQAVINSEGKIVNSGIINAERSVQLTTKSAVLNNGVLDSQQQHIQVTAQADIKQNGTVIARHGNVNFTTAKSIAQNGTTLAQGNISYQAETIQATANATLAAGMKDDLTLDERSNNGKNITLSATGRVSVQGENLASNRLTVSGQTVDLSHGRTTANHVQLTASSDKINLDNSRIAAQQRFVAVTPTTLSTRSAQIDAGQFSITASQLDNTLGTLASRTNAAFDLTLPNGINNTQGQIYGAGNLVFNTSSLQNRQGIILGQSVDLNITDLQNADGKILSKSDLTAITQTFNNTDGSVVAQNALDIQSTSLNNANGTVFAVGNAAVKAENVNNTQQGRIVSQSNLTLTALAVDNQGGFIQGQNTTIDTTQLNNNATDGTGSLIGAVRQLAIKAQFIANQYTKATATTPTQGLQAQKIALNSTALSNKNGGIYAENSISISLDSQLNNQQGEILAADALTIHQNSNQLMVDNAEGQIEAGRNLGIYAKGITNQGNITTTGNATIALQDSYTLNKAFTAGENLSFSTQGNFINTVQQVVNNALTIYARNIENQNGAELSSKATTLQTGTLTNRGLIDGTENVIQADTVDNIGTGRIYGNHLAIEAKQINNQAETVNNSTSAATIAARERLDLGVGTLINRDHSLILSLSEMAIGGSLDKQQRAAGKANLIDNGSATIEALGNGTINTANLFNHDLYLTTQVVNTTEYVHEMALTGDSQRYRVGVEGSFDWGGRSAWFDFYDERETLIQKEWYGWKYNRTTSTTQIATQDPGLMTFGGNLTLNGDNLRNQYSKLLVGNTLILGDTAYTQNTDNGTLSAGNVTLVNEDLKQQINVTETGYSYFLQHYRKHGRNGHRETNEVRFNISKPTQEADFGVVQNIIGNTSVISENTVDRNVAARSDAADTAVTSVQLTTLNTTGDNAQIADGSITIKTVTPMVTLPQASLYRINPSADSHYLVETDPKFTDVGQWLSSDYMFNALRYEPTAMLKRLGDGYYEQRLVNEQINQLTGYRYLTGYQSDYEQYKALMDNGIKYAEQFDLTPGVALTEAQMKELTTDLVWFVNQNVTLTDGSTVSVLVPRVYLVARNTDITQDGGLISANHIIATGSGNIENSGVIAGRALTALTATSISNLGGTLRGQTLLLNATQNLNNLGGRLLADTRLFAKAKTINIASTTAENIDDGNFYQKALNRVADVTVSNTQGEGLLVLQSEEDITVKGADMTVNGTTIINAGGNLNLTTLETVNKEHYTADSNNYYHLDQSKEVGNNLTLNGNATLQAANNITVRNSNITAEKQLNLIANHGDINITSGREKESLATARKWNSHGLLSKTTSISKYEHHYDTSTGSNISGEGIILAAEKGNVAVTGSSVVANHSLSMQAGNDVTVTADTNTVKTYSYSESKKSGLMGTGGIGFTIGTKKQSDEYKTYAVTQSDAASAVGSLGGDVAILSGNKATVLGSDMIAPTDNTITVQAKSLSVEAGQDIIATDETHVVKQSGLTLALSTPVTDSLL
ncbi:filamentous hemagglutinin N-terminal domain-containing protein, partial [Pasteurellaceae bacterium LIM206]|nr:filamentous hemagglutinin N-terminal domain-containing protein [Pasteurellaceae bacterium LIM206]